MNKAEQMAEYCMSKYHDRFKQEITVAVHWIFRQAQKELNIETGDEPIWSNITEYINKLTDECKKVLEWQNNNKEVILDEDLEFDHRGFKCELSSCTTLSRFEQLSNADKCFTDRYVCWLWGHKDNDGKTKEQSDDPDTWTPRVYLIPDAWSWGAEYDCMPGATVNALILEALDKFIQEVGEDNL